MIPVYILRSREHRLQAAVRARDEQRARQLLSFHRLAKQHDDHAVWLDPAQTSCLLESPEPSEQVIAVERW